MDQQINPIFRANMVQMLYQREKALRGIVSKRRFQLTFEQLREAEPGEPLGEAMTEAMLQITLEFLSCERYDDNMYLAVTLNAVEHDNATTSSNHFNMN